MRTLVIFISVLLIVCCVENKLINSNRISDNIVNFSFEFIEETVKSNNPYSNIIISPITVWTALAVIAEGARDNTLREISRVIHIDPSDRPQIREDFKKIQSYLEVNTSTIQLNKLNFIFADQHAEPIQDFKNIAKDYDVSFATLNFTAAKETANYVNKVVKDFTQGRISEIVTSQDLFDSNMILTSSIYFKGQWKFLFQRSSTTVRPFYDGRGKKIGNVNMMYNRALYSFVSDESLKVRIIELPYGKENRLSMLIMKPFTNVSVHEMLNNLKRTSLDNILQKLDQARIDFPEDEVEVFLPRFKSATDLDIKASLKKMGIRDLFDNRSANLKNMLNIPSYVSKVAHKAVIEVTEEGTTASAATTATFSNRIGATRFEANQPFGYIIVEKTTNTIAFAGTYLVPQLY